MIKMDVHSLPINEVMIDLAKAFETVYTCNCDEYTIEIPEKYGKGMIYGIMFDSGLGMINYEVEFNDEVVLNFVKNNVHPVKCIFCYEGTVLHAFIDSDEPFDVIQKYQNAIFASQGHKGHILTFPANQLIKINSIEINREQFRKKFNCPINDLSPEMQGLFNDVRAEANFSYRGDYSLYISDIIANIKQHKGNGFLRRTFLEAKGYELLTLQLAQFLDDQQDTTHKAVLRHNELALVEKANDYIKNNLASPLTIKVLAKVAGLNETKLQKGFQHLYGKTINNYIQEYRLEEGSRLLISSDKNINEIVRIVGLVSSSYFSKIFKEKYGLTPKAFQTKYLRK